MYICMEHMGPGYGRYALSASVFPGFAHDSNFSHDLAHLRCVLENLLEALMEKYVVDEICRKRSHSQSNYKLRG